LKDDKKQIITESEDRIKQAEKTIEEEKENLIHELSRAKAAAVSCLLVGKAKEEEKENLIHELSRAKAAVMFIGG
jgi:phenylpyruvate tautomerase PptA (4-oxalocrotonate tautomerase family)